MPTVRGSQFALRGREVHPIGLLPELARTARGSAGLQGAAARTAEPRPDAAGRRADFDPYLRRADDACLLALRVALLPDRRGSLRRGDLQHGERRATVPALLLRRPCDPQGVERGGYPGRDDRPLCRGQPRWRAVASRCRAVVGAELRYGALRRRPALVGFLHGQRGRVEDRRHDLHAQHGTRIEERHGGRCYGPDADLERIRAAGGRRSGLVAQLRTASLGKDRVVGL